MKLSKTSTLAALAMARLATENGQDVIQARQVAEHLGVPTDSALKILQSLSRRGLIQSQLGRGGGYRLRSRPEEVTLLDVVEAIDGPVEPAVALTTDSDAFSQAVARLEVACQTACTQVRQALAGVTVSDLAGLHGPQILAVAG